MGPRQPLPRSLRFSIAFSPLLLLLVPFSGARSPSNPPAAVSKAAAAACSAKVQKLQDFAADPERGKKQTTRFSQAELNSYLAFELSSKYHPSLKSLEIQLQEAKLEGTAAIDFDQLGMASKGMMGKLVAKLFSGVHNLRIRGQLHAEGGQAYLVLDEAHFDDTSLPNFLIEEVITAVGRKQKPPFDPLKPSQMPYAIDRVDVHTGHILVHQ
jgi:hypothetical protein